MKDVYREGIGISTLFRLLGVPKVHFHCEQKEGETQPFNQEQWESSRISNRKLKPLDRLKRFGKFKLSI